MLKQLVKLFKVLNSDVDPSQIAGGLVLGMVLGLTPLWSLHNILVLLLVCILRINVSAVLISLAVFSGLAYLLDPLFILVGEKVLTSPDLAALWTSLYQQDIWRLAHFNNTLTMGSVLISIALLVPVFFLFRIIIIQYRERILAWVMKLHIVQVMQASKLFLTYRELSAISELKP